MDRAVTDRRVRRTRQAIRTAFQELIHEKGYDAITVKDILDRADVGRSTFYAHFRDKEHLLVSGFDDIREAAGGTAGSASAPAATVSDALEPTLAVFRHVEEYRGAWKPLVRHGGAESVTRILRDTSESILREQLMRCFGDYSSGADIEGATQFCSGGLIGLLTWWLDSGVPRTAVDVHSMFNSLAAPGIERLLSSRR